MPDALRTVPARLCLALLLLLLASPLGAEEASVPDVTLPHVGTLGTAPSGADALVVTATGAGDLYLGTQGPLSLLGLRNALRQATADPTTREPDRSSRLNLLVNADASLPWVVTQWILQVAAEPTVGLYRVFLGARPRDGDARGAIACWLPKDRGLAPTVQHVVDESTVTASFFWSEQDASDPEALLPLLTRLRPVSADRRDLVFRVDAPQPHGCAVPSGFVVRTIDVALRFGFEHVRFEGSGRFPTPAEADDPEWLRLEVRAWKALAGTASIRLGSTWVGRAEEDAEASAAFGLLPEVYGAGLVGAAPLVEDVVKEVVEEQPGPDDLVERGAGGAVVGLGGGAGGAFRGRSGRRSLTDPAERAIREALRWLAAHQAPLGYWDADGFGQWCHGERVPEGEARADGPGSALHDVGVTGLALLAFLGTGQTNRGRGPHAKVVSSGLRYLKQMQDPEGCFGPRVHGHFIYNHAIATLALVEAYGRTHSPMFKGAAQRGLDFLVRAQNPGQGWRYGVRTGQSDTSVTAWALLALQSARLVNEEREQAGRPPLLTLDDAAIEAGLRWMDAMTDPETGRTGYLQRGGPPARLQSLAERFPSQHSEAPTAMGVAVRRWEGAGEPAADVVRRGIALCAACPPVWNPASGQIDLVYWHFGTLALRKAGRPLWPAWRQALRTALCEHQRRDGTACTVAGSWDPVGAWGIEGGRVYATALAARMLAVQ